MIEFLGLCVENLIRSIKYVLTGQLRFSEVISKAASISYDSLSISLIIAFISAAVIAIQVSKQFLMTGAESYIGGTLAIVMIREIAPGFVALAIGARAGTAISAEIANMQVTSQVDAMKTLNVNPIQYLILPKVLAGIVIVPMAVIIAATTGILGGLFTSVAHTELTVVGYLESVRIGLFVKDICACMVKGAVFGCIIAVVCATIGYETKGGALDVGKATTKAVVWSITIMAIFDYIISALFI